MATPLTSANAARLSEVRSRLIAGPSHTGVGITCGQNVTRGGSWIRRICQFRHVNTSRQVSLTVCRTHTSVIRKQALPAALSACDGLWMSAPAAAFHTRASLSDDLKRLGVHVGDMVMVHASMSRVGRLLNGPDALIGALLDAVGPSGTLLAYADWDGAYDELLDEDGRVPPDGTPTFRPSIVPPPVPFATLAYSPNISAPHLVPGAAALQGLQSLPSASGQIGLLLTTPSITATERDRPWPT